MLVSPLPPRPSFPFSLDSVLGLGTAASTMSAIRVAGELDDLAGGQVEELLEAVANVDEHLTALLGGAALAAGNVAISASGNALSYGASPHANAEEGLADVDDNTHDLTVLLILESLADGGEHDVQPNVVNGDAALLLELVGPLAAVLVLHILPFGADALLEQVVVGLEGELRDGGDVVVHTPELLNRVERDDLLQQVIPVVALRTVSADGVARFGGRLIGGGHTLPLGGLVNHRVHLF